MLRSSQASTPSANETEDRGPQEPDDKPPDQPAADKRGSKSVARNVAHFSVSEGLSTSSDVTAGDARQEGPEAECGECDQPQMQRATGDNSSCRSVSQKNQKRRGGDSNSRSLAGRRFSRPVQSAALPPLRGGNSPGQFISNGSTEASDCWRQVTRPRRSST